ncbi:CRISPR-associated endonuclease Cas4g/Cas1g [Bacillus methanolicus]|uniref:CRISPR-associated endonuclease Cas4g/Cas1g n=1 Tax=Bacillus methanolicus TaxID=1471 RepID=UPI002380A1CF|nr:CRISPR-associated endonuclease Cas1 [Bacillus methanolicus]
MSIPIRMLNEIQYCERLYYIMHVQGIFEESADTIEGDAQHRRAENRMRKGTIAPTELWGEAPLSLHLGDDHLNIVGKLDTVTLEKDLWVPVESKHSSAPDGSQSFKVETYDLQGTAWPNDQIQLCAQGLLLRANGYSSDYGYLYYRGNKKKVRVDFTQDLINLTNYYIRKAHELINKPIPKPLKDSNKCFRCSLNYVCLPDETNYLIGASTNIRKIVPNRDDGGILYVSEPGTKLGKSGESLTIRYPDGRSDEIPIKDIIHVSLMGNVQCSTQLTHTLMACGITISYLSTHGQMIGYTMPPVTKNIFLRKNQFIKFQHYDHALRLSQWIIYAKISNQRTLLRRNGSAPKSLLQELKELRDKAISAESIESLRGIEGRAAKLYFEAFPTMLKLKGVDRKAFMNGRNRRPPKDPVNALLSLGYTLLARDVLAACTGVGLDPMFGFYHSIEPGRPALALDLMEPFRPLIVDSVVLRILNTQELDLDDFYRGEDSCQLNKNGRKKFFAAYERRLHETLTHPRFGYKISYRRTLDVEVRLLARYLEGEVNEYRPVTTR